MTQEQQLDNPILTGYDRESRLPYWASWQPKASAVRPAPLAVVGMGRSLREALSSLYLQMAWSSLDIREGGPCWQSLNLELL
jgi:hypothetical protein